MLSSLKRFSLTVLPFFALSPLYAAACGGSGESSTGTGGAGGSASSANASSSSSSSASASSSSSGQGTGGGGGGAFMPANHPAAPQVVTLNGPALTTPKVIAITYNADPNQADADKFMAEASKSTFWAETTSEYGVGPLTVAPPIHIATAPKSMSDAALLNNLSINLSGANPPWGAPDASAIYTFIIPEGIDVTAGGSCCQDYYGYHDEVKIGGKKLAYAIVCTCTDPMHTSLEMMTSTAAHELIEAATDPFPQTAPAWAQTADADAAWSVITEGELSDMCEFDGDQYATPKDMTYVVQRSWSNKAAAAGKDPCLPVVAPDVYFNSAVVATDIVTVPFYGSMLAGNAIKIPVGMSRTVDVDLFSEAPTAGPWTLKVVDYNALYGGKANLKFALDKTTGMNGDVLHLTITVMGTDPTIGAEPFYIESTLGNASNIWMGMVGQ